MREAGRVFRRHRDGRFVARYIDEDGRRREVVRDTPEAASSARSEIIHGIGYTPDQPLQTFLRWWIDVHCSERVAGGSLARNTLRGYASNVRLYLIPLIGKHSLRLAAQHVEDLLAEMRKMGRSGRTRQYVHATLRAALKIAMRNDLVDRNAASLVPAPAATRRPFTPMWNDETRRLLVACASDRDGPLWALLVTAARYTCIPLYFQR